jgi:hypothetical protein
MENLGKGRIKRKMEGSRIWDALEAVVTPENVNCIPQDWEPWCPVDLYDDQISWRYDLKVCKLAHEGFLVWLLTTSIKRGVEVFQCFLQKWHSFIDWPRARKNGLTSGLISLRMSV